MNLIAGERTLKWKMFKLEPTKAAVDGAPDMVVILSRGRSKFIGAREIDRRGHINRNSASIGLTPLTPIILSMAFVDSQWKVAAFVNDEGRRCGEPDACHKGALCASTRSFLGSEYECWS